ncbi:MAG: ABC transporter permease [Lysobacterales bacterium]|jgi:putative ABC transport system permease protein
MELKPILSAMRHRKTGVLLIVLQVALTLAILANALYVVRDRMKESQRPTGVEDAVVFHIGITDKERDTTGAVSAADLDALRAMPGVVAASVVNQVPLSNSGNNSGFDVKPNLDNSLTTAATYHTSANIADTWGLRIVEGRTFRADEELFIDEDLTGQPDPTVALVSSTMAKVLYPNETSVVGKPLYWGNTGPIEIVGVIDTLVTPWGRSSWGGGDGTHSVVFAARRAGNWGTYAIRVDDPANLQRLIRESQTMLQARVPGRMVEFASTMGETRERRYEGEHTMINGLLIVMALLLVMTASGIVGLASLWVNQRRKQIGVRRALGARRIDILRLFVTENVLITGAGALVGCALALGLNALMMDQLELSRLPLGYLGVGSVVLLLLGFGAVLGPAFRAASVAPATATRSA